MTLRSPCLAALFFVGSLTSSLAAPTGPAKQLIDHLGMELIPVEGCWFKLTYTSAIKLAGEALPARYGAPRPAGGAIYALVTREDFSCLHRLKTDEVWHFYAGDPIELLLLQPEGHSEVVVLGSDLLAGQHPQFTVPAGAWMGARPVKASADAYGFFGTTMAPGFDYGDFEVGYRDELQRSYPAQRDLIAALTRAEQATRPATPAPAEAKAPPQPTVFLSSAVAPVSFAPGAELRELIGLTGHAKTVRTSIAGFTLAPGKTTGLSYLKSGEEYFLVTKGRGTVVVGAVTSPVEAGSIVFLAPEVRHSITAAADSSLEFYAVSTPAFSPENYVPVPAVK